MTKTSNTTDPRVEAGAKAWDKHMGGRYAPDEVEELAEEVAVILAAADAVDPRKPRTITTVEEVSALPNGSQIQDADPALCQKVNGRWYLPGSDYDYGDIHITLPATVLHEPEAEAAR